MGGLVHVSVEDIEVMENSRSQMWCEVPFDLPTDIEVIWRFAEEVSSASDDSCRGSTYSLRLYLSVVLTRKADLFLGSTATVLVLEMRS